MMGPGCDKGGGGEDTAAEPGPDTVGPGPDTVGPGPDTLEPGPDTWEPGPDTLEPGPDTWEPGPDTSEPPPDVKPFCGDGTCNEDEDPCTCPVDCPVGDGVPGAACCDAMDCAQPKCGPCCVVTCDDFVCSEETWLSDCCWNGECEEGEDWESCPEDCPMPDTKCEDYFACLADADCVKTSQGCCPCSMGGISIAMNAECVDEYNEALDCPPDLMCSAVYNCDDSTPACEDGHCVL